MAISGVSTATQGVSQTQQSQLVKSQRDRDGDNDKSRAAEADKSTQFTLASTATVGSNINTTA